MNNIRERYNLNHRVIQAFRLGRLTTVCQIPVMPGDSMSIAVNGFVRMNPFRRPLAFDVRLNAWGFFQPLRWTYPKIPDALVAHRDLTSGEVPTVAMTDHAPAVLLNNGTNSVLKHRLDDYVRIYNQYFRAPHTTAVTNAALTGGGYNGNYGLRLTALPTMHTTPLPVNEREAKSQDHDSARLVSGNNIDVSGIPPQMERWREEQLRTWTSLRFREIHQRLFGTPGSPEADQVPHFVGRAEKWFSTSDVDGTAAAELGSTVGKSVTSIRWKMPKRFFTEHGTINVLLGCRPHPVFQRERHVLESPTRFRNYENLFGSLEGTAKLPVPLNMSDLYWDGQSSVSAGYVPNLEWYRNHPNFVSRLLDEEDTGYEGRPTPASADEAQYVPDYDDVFSTVAAGHGKIMANNSVTVNRLVADGFKSIMAQTGHGGM